MAVEEGAVAEIEVTITAGLADSVAEAEEEAASLEGVVGPIIDIT